MEPIDLPSGPHFISSIAVDSESLVLRLVPEAFERDASAFEIRAEGCNDAVPTNEFLRRLMQDDEYVHVFWREGALIFGSESDEIEVRARSISGGPSEFRPEEWRSHLELFRTLYENAESVLRARTLQLQEIRDLLIEQHRRVELKSGAREATSAAGLLYRQQLEFIEKVLRATEI